jgi:hypothetical protein
MYLFLSLTLYMFRAHRAHHQERQIVSIQPLVTVTLCRCPYRVQVGSEQQKQHHSYRIGTWNVRTLNQGGKLENLKKEIRKNEVSVLGVSEVRWKGQGEIRSEIGRAHV